ncbi:hypothetical protein STRIP9103_05125 [Streptomyces ipomoeae 91-03]|uniref:Uncharacterized protein n=1 Tax=Streptomyces ipomoeae 91-03 TaxID=698759 RepID=L1KRQ6_9ACTN|nr:hypothetical protein STRIP9103_05125 [Streptomyces ipomoeae 91-03]
MEAADVNSLGHVNHCFFRGSRGELVAVMAASAAGRAAEPHMINAGPSSGRCRGPRDS